MSTFGEKLAAAREARPTKDVQIILDGELSKERERLLAEIDSADDEQRLGVKSSKDELKDRLVKLQEMAQDSLVTLRFTRLPGRDWAALTSRHPVRPDVPIDRHYGYNYDAVCEEAAALSGVRIEDDVEVPMIVEAKTTSNPNPTNEWAELFDVLSGSEIASIRDAVWALNEWEPQQRIEALVKGSGAATRSVSN